MRNGHDLFFVLVVVIVLIEFQRDVFAVLVDADQGQHAARADLVATAAAYAFFLVQVLHKGRRPGRAAGQGDREVAHADLLRQAAAAAASLRASISATWVS